MKALFFDTPVWALVLNGLASVLVLFVLFNVMQGVFARAGWLLRLAVGGLIVGFGLNLLGWWLDQRFLQITDLIVNLSIAIYFFWLWWFKRLHPHELYENQPRTGRWV